MPIQRRRWSSEFLRRVVFWPSANVSENVNDNVVMRRAWGSVGGNIKNSAIDSLG
jgi:hypothetical protein